jgi:cysteine desulfurase/selenocysteine lyase
MKRTSTDSADAKLQDLRDQFPLLKEEVHGQRVVYLDSAATTQRPRAMLDALTNFYSHDNANPARSLHALAQRSTIAYESARATVARFLNAHSPEDLSGPGNECPNRKTL